MPTGDRVIEVVVTNSVSHEPVRKANVGVFGPFAGANSVTDASGKAVFEHLPDGQFTVRADHPSYPPPRRTGGWLQQVELKAGERKRQVAISMVPAASLTGRVTDEEGDPLLSCNVHVMRRDPMQKGRMTSVANGQTKPTGEYRVFNLAPGRYYVAASCQGPNFVPHPLSDQPPLATVRFLPQVYPGVSDFTAATMIDLAPGVERSGVDFRMAQGAVASAVINLFPPELPQGSQLQVLLVPRDPFIQALQGMQGGGFNPKAGGYVFERLLPGSYEAVAFSVGPAGKAYGGRTNVEVEENKVAEINLPVGYGSDLPGKIETDDGSPLNAVGAQVYLQAIGDSPGPGGQQNAKVEENGSFTVPGMLPGQWRVRVFGLPNNGFVKSVSLGDREIPDRIVEMTAGAGPLRIVAGTKGGTVEGNLLSDGGTPANTQIVLFPDSGDDDQLRVTNSQGAHFQLANVPPGKYRLVALGSSSMGISPDMGTALGALGKGVEVEEGASLTADVKVLSAEEVQKALATDPE
jgi:hypothetical protein